MDRFPDRFEVPPDVGENPDAIYVDGHLEDGLSVPSFVFRRLVGIGHAYGLHYLGSVLRYDEETRLEPVQCESVIEEIEFIGELVRDPLLVGALEPVLGFLSDYSRTRQTDALVIDLES